jgi:hypothetical protein
LKINSVKRDAAESRNPLICYAMGLSSAAESLLSGSVTAGCHLMTVCWLRAARKVLFGPGLQEAGENFGSHRPVIKTKSTTSNDLVDA